MTKLHFFLYSPLSLRHLTRLLHQTSIAFNYTNVPLPSVSNPLIRNAFSLQTAPQRRKFQSLFDAVGMELDYAGIDRFQINQLVWKLLLPRFANAKVTALNHWAKLQFSIPSLSMQVIKFQSENLKGRAHLGLLCIDVRIILKWFLKKHVWTGFACIMMETNNGLLWICYCTHGFHKNRRINFHLILCNTETLPCQ